MISSREMAVSTPLNSISCNNQSQHPNYLGGVIPYQTEIGKGTVITYHGLGVVLNKNAIIGENCWIRQHVTFASNEKGAPVLGDEVQIGAGAVIVGNVYIGDNAKIGALAFVNKDIQANCTAVGVPAKPVKFN